MTSFVARCFGAQDSQSRLRRVEASLKLGVPERQGCCAQLIEKALEFPAAEQSPPKWVSDNASIYIGLNWSVAGAYATVEGGGGFFLVDSPTPTVWTGYQLTGRITNP